MRREPVYHLYVSKRGNVFMGELASLIGRTLEDLGRQTVRHTAELPEPGENRVNVVVAPHEFFHFSLIGGHSEEQVKHALGSAVCVTTEQPGTSWFEIEADLCREAPLVLDINRTGAAELAARGVHARFLQIGYHESMDAWRSLKSVETSMGGRVRDIAVLAAKTDRRTEVLARAAPLLWNRACDLRLFTFEHPVVEGSAGFLSGTNKWSYLASTKILLNIHRGELGYFEWLRVIEAIANGCVVVTESAVGHQPLVPFEHFIPAPLTALAEYADALLCDEAWRSDIAVAAYEFCRSELSMRTIVADVLPEVEDAANAVRGCAPSKSVVKRFTTRSDATRPIPASADIRQSVDGNLLRKFRSEAKRVIISQRAAIRDIEKIQAALSYGSDDHLDTEVSKSFTGFAPEVSVVLTNYNYSDLVITAMASVRATRGVRTELIVVDDHSMDESVTRIRETMAEYPWFPTRLVMRKANRGLSEARNIGFEYSRADYVFVLDADNVVYPSGIDKLFRELTEAGESCAFAYGVIDCFRDSAQTEPLDLVSCLPWDPYRLTRSNYIDAMALVRKKAWRDVGGYDWRMDEHFGGWEDFDLWLRFASRGYSAAFVASPVARYRVHSASMLHLFNWAPEGAVRELRRRYPDLPWPPLSEGSEQ